MFCVRRECDFQPKGTLFSNNWVGGANVRCFRQSKVKTISQSLNPYNKYIVASSCSIGPIGTAICAYRADNSVERGETGFNRGIFDIFREDLQDAQGNEFESTFVECNPLGRSSDDSQLIQVIQDVSQIGENPFLVLDGLMWVILVYIHVVRLCLFVVVYIIKQL